MTLGERFCVGYLRQHLGMEPPPEGWPKCSGCGDDIDHARRTRDAIWDNWLAQLSGGVDCPAIAEACREPQP